MPQEATIEHIDRRLLVSAPSSEVWAVVTSDGWLAERVEFDLIPGGEARFLDGDSVRTGWVEFAEPPRAAQPAQLVFWWGPDGEPATRVELTLTPGDEASTLLRVVESRPLETLDLVGLPLPGESGTRHGPAMLAVA